MAYPITIVATVNGKGFDGTLQSAFDLLRSEHVAVEGGAHVVSEAEHTMLVLIATEAGRSKAIDVLVGAGFRLKTGATD